MRERLKIKDKRAKIIKIYQTPPKLEIKPSARNPHLLDFY